jgi:MerR family transcriptional regulator, redox-sensitive transcriptional activator SoxR
MFGMSIGEAARKAGLRPSAIRYYEKLGLLAKAWRVNGRRRYDDQILRRLAIVRFARHVGFTLTETKLLLDGFDMRPPSQRWHALARNKLTQLDKLIAEAKDIRELLQETVQHKCPKLAERGSALSHSRASFKPKSVRRGRRPLA